MNEPAQATSDTPTGAKVAVFEQAIADLRAAGAQQVDAVHLHYLEVLALRAATQQGRVRDKLEGRFALAVEAFRSRLNASEPASQPYVEPESHARPDLPRSPLANLTRYLGAHLPQPVPQSSATERPARHELKSVRQFRNTWSKLSAEHQLNRALDQAPRNAGPINSHMLVLKSLALMRDISPDYLNRFMAYADALLCLEQPVKEVPQGKAATDAGGAKRSRGTRAKTPSRAG